MVLAWMGYGFHGLGFLFFLCCFALPIALVVALIVGLTRRNQGAPPRYVPPAATPAAMPAAGWYADPRGRHQQRYWDGARWTDHVADSGAVSSDPL